MYRFRFTPSTGLSTTPEKVYCQVLIRVGKSQVQLQVELTLGSGSRVTFRTGSALVQVLKWMNFQFCTLL